MNESFFDDPGVDGNYTRLRTESRPAEQIAARKSAGRSGSWRRRIFTLVANNGTHGMTSIEVANALAKQTPCPDCDCTHRPPISVNVITTRLGELRDWHYLMHRMDDDHTPMLRTTDNRTAEIHILTHKGLIEWRT